MLSNSEHICEYLAYYVAFEQAPRFAVLIDGRWGIGKTYLIEAFLASVRTTEFQAVYVSLSGLGASAEIDRELFRATSGRSNWSCNGTAMPSVRNSRLAWTSGLLRSELSRMQVRTNGSVGGS